MQRIVIQKSGILALVVALTLAVTCPALADKPSWAGGKDKGGKNKQENRQTDDQDRPADGPQGRQASAAGSSICFSDRQRVVIREYYGEHYHSGHCPPGLAKKNNRCMPPGQAKKWHVGQPLPRDVIFYDLSPAVLVKVGPPPSGYRFVRVASDILLIAVGTGMIMDAIKDLHEM